jgi:hypothetical protein
METGEKQSSKKTDNINPVYHFLKDNAPVITLFTTLGTLLALLPTFYEKIGNEISVGSFGYNGLILLFLSGVLFIFWLILIVLLLFEAANSNDNLLITALSFTLFIFLYGVLSSVFNIVKQYVIGDFIQWYVILFFYIPLAIVIIVSLIVYAKSQNRFTATGQIQKVKILPLLIIAAVLIGCFLFWFGVGCFFNYVTDIHRTSLMNNFEENVSIITESEFYNPTIPDSVGMGLALSGINGLQKNDLTDYSYQWTTNYGYFITWLPDERRSVFLSNSTVIPGNKSFEKIFWTYPHEDLGKEKPNVTIQLRIENNSGTYYKFMALDMSWSSTDIAQVSSLSTSKIFQTPNTTVPKDNMTVTEVAAENAPYKELNTILKFINKANNRNFTTQFYDPMVNNKSVFQGYFIDTPGGEN